MATTLQSFRRYVRLAKIENRAYVGNLQPVLVALAATMWFLRNVRDNDKQRAKVLAELEQLVERALT